MHICCMRRQCDVHGCETEKRGVCRRYSVARAPIIARRFKLNLNILGHAFADFGQVRKAALEPQLRMPQS